MFFIDIEIKNTCVKLTINAKIIHCFHSLFVKMRSFHRLERIHLHVYSAKNKNKQLTIIFTLHFFFHNIAQFFLD